MADEPEGLIPQEINLYQEQFHPVREPLDGRAILLAGLAAVVLMGMGVLYYQEKLKTLRQEIARLTAEEGRLAAEVAELNRQFPPPVKDEELEAQVARLAREQERKKGVVNLLKGEQVGNPRGFSHLLRAMGRGKVEGVWLTSFGFRKGGEELMLEGLTTSPARLPGLMNALSGQEPFQGKRFRYFQMSPDEKREGVIRFQLGSVEPPPEQQKGAKSATPGKKGAPENGGKAPAKQGGP